jgi:flagellar biosynthesis chaperone FliJ
MNIISKETKLQTLEKAQSTIQRVNQQLADVEKLVYANDPHARAALQSLEVTLAAADHELTHFEKLMEEADAADSDAIKFSINLPRRSN